MDLFKDNKIDLHIHSSYSDGSDSLKELVEKVQKAGIIKFSLTDHDTIDGNLEIVNIIPEEIEFINGVELTCKARGINCHILGYDYNLFDTGLRGLISEGKILRKKKLETRIDYLKTVWQIELTQEELEWLYSRRSVVKTHVANILVKRGVAKDNLSAMEKYLDDCKTPNSRFDGERAIQIIKNAGGIPVWAHPLGGEGEAHLSEKDFLVKLEIMKECGIEGLECHYARYNENEINFLLKCAKENDLKITGGSDYHGKNKNIPLGKLRV